MKIQQKIFYCVFFVVCLLCDDSFSQVKVDGIPYLQNFSIDDYTNDQVQASTQNWCVYQDEKDLMYFGNTNGVLFFDGFYWSMLEMPNSITVRSIKGGNDGRIYIGGKRQFGYLTNGIHGNLVYTSLVPKMSLHDQKSFTDVWNIYAVDDRVIFETAEKVFAYENDTIHGYIPYGGIKNSFVVNNDVYFLDSEKGLLRFKRNDFQIISDHEIFKSYGFAIDGFENDMIYVSRKTGFYSYNFKRIRKLHVDDIELILEKKPYCGVKISNDQIAIGTQVGGIFIIDKNWKIITVFNKSSGLHANTVYNLFLDTEKNLWAALGNGISYFKINSPFSYYKPILGIPKKNYTAQTLNDKIYFGNEVGIYCKPVKPINSNLEVNRFEFLEGTGGQSFDLLKNEDYIVAAHSSGILVIKDGRIVSKASADHIWSLRQSKSIPNRFFAFTKKNIVVFEVLNDRIVNLRQLKGHNDNCRYSEIQNDTVLWVTNDVDGISRLVISKDATSILYKKQYTTENGLPSMSLNHPVCIFNTMYFATEKGIYRFHDHSIVKDSILIPDYETVGPTNLLGMDQWHRLWIQDNLELRWINPDKKITFRPFIPFKGQDLSRISVVGKNDVYFSGDKFVIHYSPDCKFNEDSLYNVHIRNVINLRNDSLIICGYRHLFHDTLDMPIIDSVLLLSPKKNNLRFEYAATYFENPDQTVYQVWLEGFEDNNLNWSHETSKDYTNLRHGEYVFHVRARNAYDLTSQTTTFKFEILKPWYFSNYAYIIYGLLIFLIIYIILRIYTYSLKTSNLRLEELIKERTKEIETQKEEILTQSEQLAEYNKELEKLSIVARETDNAILIVNPNGEIEWINEGFTRLFGYTLNDYHDTSRNIYVLSAHDRIADKIAHCINLKESVNYETRNKCKNGTFVWTQTTLTPILDGEGEVIKLIAIDTNINKIKIAEEEIKKQKDFIEQQNVELEKHRNRLEHIVDIRTKDLIKEKEKAQESDRLKTSFLANMSHEIRTPLNAIVGFTELLNEEDLSIEERLNLGINIEKSANSLIKLIEDIIDTAKLESHQMVLSKRSINIHSIITEVFEEAVVKLKSENVELKLVLPESIKDVQIINDPNRLKQVISKLVENALKFTDEGYVQLSCKKSINEDVPVFEIQVKDTGIGLTEKKLEMVFGRFNKAEENHERLFRGAGLGLYICRGLIALMGGKIWVKSEINVGSEFTFIVPMS